MIMSSTYTKKLKELRKIARRLAHEKYKELLPPEEIKKLKGDEMIRSMYIKNQNRKGNCLELSPISYKGIYKVLKKQLQREGQYGY